MYYIFYSQDSKSLHEANHFCKKKQCKYLVLRGAYEPQQRSFPASSSAAAAALAAEVLPPPQPAKSPWRTTPSPSPTPTAKSAAPARGGPGPAGGAALGAEEWGNATATVRSSRSTGCTTAARSGCGVPSPPLAGSGARGRRCGRRSLGRAEGCCSSGR